MDKTAKQYYEDINLFRGFAIWLIVSQHMMQVLVFENKIENNWNTDWGFIHRYMDVLAGL